MVVILFFIGFPLLFRLTDKKRNKARERCMDIVKSKAGKVLSINENYQALKREYEYDVEWEDSDGNKHNFKYHPAYPLTEETITEI